MAARCLPFPSAAASRFIYLSNSLDLSLPLTLVLFPIKSHIRTHTQKTKSMCVHPVAPEKPGTHQRIRTTPYLKELGLALHGREVTASWNENLYLPPPPPAAATSTVTNRQHLLLPLSLSNLQFWFKD